MKKRPTQRAGAMKVYREVAKLTGYSSNKYVKQMERDWERVRNGGGANTRKAAFQLGYILALELSLKTAANAAHSVEAE